MKAYPLESISIEDAKKMQFKLVESCCKFLTGEEILESGDLGVSKPYNMPRRTRVVEKILADFFSAEDCVLLRGAGTNAIRLSLCSLLDNDNSILVHKAPIYKTTEVTLKSMKVNIIEYDFNDLSNLKECIISNNIKTVLLQHSRQKLDDSYNLNEVIQAIKNIDKEIKILIDDNYAVLKTSKNSIEMGATLSAFSSFKLQGPVGVGIVIGDRELISKIHEMNYSGGSQVQGFESMEVLRGLIQAPVSLAIQAEELNKLKDILDNKKIYKFIKNSVIANAQSKVLLVEFNDDIAEEILRYSHKLGALSHPVGAESRFDISPLIYRVSGTFLSENPSLYKKMIRINPNKASAELIAKIILKSYEMWEEECS